MINLELFPCSGGMARGFRDAGIEFDLAIEWEADHCDSYERNMGHRPVQMDVRDLLRMAKLGAFRPDVDLLIADPPCTPWSRAGKRLGTEDDRDMLAITCEIIAELRPLRYLIGNVPGLDDSTNLGIVQRHIGGLLRLGYCTADFVQIDAADHGVPQHRRRPFWFGHRVGTPCIRWPAPTHGDPLAIKRAAAQGTLGGMSRQLKPWVTCRQALQHLSPEGLGKPVRMRKRKQNGHQHGSVADRPSRVVGTSNLSDGNVLTYCAGHPPSYSDEPAMTVGAGCGGGATRAISFASRDDEPVHSSDPDQPARTITTQCRAAGHASTLLINDRHLPADADAPSPTIGAKPRGQSGNVVVYRQSTQCPQSQRTMDPDRPATTVSTATDRAGSGSPKLEWPWDRSFLSDANAVQLSERAAMVLQGFPEGWAICGETKKARWSQIGQAMPPALAQAVATSIVEQDRAARTAWTNAYGHAHDEHDGDGPCAACGPRLVEVG